MDDVKYLKHRRHRKIIFLEILFINTTSIENNQKYSEMNLIDVTNYFSISFNNLFGSFIFDFVVEVS